jgi:hypothetical protein
MREGKYAVCAFRIIFKLLFTKNLEPFLDAIQGIGYFFFENLVLLFLSNFGLSDRRHYIQHM